MCQRTNNWCNSGDEVTLRHSCTPNLELLTIKGRNHYLQHKLPLVIRSVVYNPPQADKDTHSLELHEAVSTLKARHHVEALIVAGDWARADPKSLLLSLQRGLQSQTPPRFR